MRVLRTGAACPKSSCASLCRLSGDGPAVTRDSLETLLDDDRGAIVPGHRELGSDGD